MRRSRLSIRDHRLAVKGQLEALGIMGGKPAAEYTTRIPEKRAPRQPSGNRLERDVVKEIASWQADEPDVTLWRNNRGDVMLASGERVRYGVGPNGACDFLGYRTIVITAAMVGAKIAQFIAVEAKSPVGQPTTDQAAFICRIIAAGGKAGVARSDADAESIIKGHSHDQPSPLSAEPQAGETRPAHD